MQKVKIHCYMGIAFLIAFFSCAKGATMPSAESRKIQNLRAFAKLYGYVKYFHPSDEASDIDWDKFAIYGVQKVKGAENSKELGTALEELFLPIAPTIQIYGKDEEPRNYSKSLPENTAGLKVVAWQHLGVRLYGWGGYKSLRLNSENKLPPDSRGWVYQTLSSEGLERCKGRDIELRAVVRTNLASPEGWGSLSINIKTAEGEIIDLLMDNRLTGMTPWTLCELKCKIPENVRRVRIGIILSGKGQIWADEMGISVVNNGDEKQSIDIPNAGFEQTDDNSDYPTQWLCPETSRYGHRTDDVKPYSGKRSLLIEPLRELFEERPKITDTIIKPLDSDLMCQVPLALYRDEQGTLGKNDHYPYARLSERLEKMDPNAFTVDDEDVRLADVVITWNVFQHFYPYFDVVHVDWDAELTPTLQKAMRDRNVTEFHDTLRLFTAKLQDGHVVIGYRSRYLIPRISWPLAVAGFPFVVDWIENQLVVTVSKDPTRVQEGDIILSIDGTDAEEVLLDLEKYYSGSPW